MHMLRVIIVYRFRMTENVRVVKDLFVVNNMTTLRDIFDQIGVSHIPADEIISINVVQD